MKVLLLVLKLREQRDQSAVDQILNSIKIAAEGQQNLFPLVIEALRNDCTLGEIISAMKRLFRYEIIRSE